MDLDDLKGAWADHGTRMERDVTIDEARLTRLGTRRLRLTLAPYVAWLAVELVLGLALLAAVTSVLAEHLDEPRYLVAGGALWIVTFWTTASCAYLVVAGAQLDSAGPVTAIQRDLERMKLVEYRALKWALLGGVLAWLPAVLMLFEAFTGVAALARVDLAYLVGNLVFGLAMLVAAHVLSRRYVERRDAPRWAQALVDAASGRGLRKAADRLEEIARFGEDDARPERSAQ